MGEESRKIRYVTIDELMKDAVPCSVAEEVRREQYVAMLKGTYSREHIIKVYHISPEEVDSVEAIEPTWLKNARTWSKLGGQIVGGEIDFAAA